MLFCGFLLREGSLNGFYVYILDDWLAQQLLNGIDLIAGDSPVPAGFAL